MRSFIVGLAVLALLGTAPALARPPENHYEIEQHCERGPDGTIMLKQYDVPK
jgi:hypothetical protein